MQVLYPGRSKDENQQQTQPTYDNGPELNPGHIGVLVSLGFAALQLAPR